jgi:NAD(P)-dependent dehydrogenase (short-subunit alcohol dehydrogenase family)
MTRPPDRILVTGASRGLGLELTRRTVARGDRVFAACRNPDGARALAALREAHPDRLQIVPLDVTDAGSILRAAAAVAERTEALDLLVNNAGIYTAAGSGEPGERLGRFGFDDALAVLRANSVAPLLVADAFLGLLKAGREPRIVSISSQLGSLASNVGTSPYYYGASKAALNMLMRSLAGETRSLGVTTVLLDPGWVRTDMGGPRAPLSVEESVAGLLTVIDGLKPGDNGRFLTWQGREQAW